MVTKNFGDIANFEIFFIKIGLGVSVLRMRDFAPLGTK